MAHERWKPTKLDAWLARNIEFFAVRWRERMQRELEVDASQRLEVSRLEVSLAADRFVFAPTDAMRDHYHQKLVAACCSERNALSHYVRVTSGQDAANALMQGWMDAQKLPPEKESH